MRSRIQRLTVTDFRSYPRASLETQGRTCFLFGPNGRGQDQPLGGTKLCSRPAGVCEGASAGEIGRRLSAEGEGLAWAVTADVDAGETSVRLGTGIVTTESPRRQSRVAGEAVSVSGLAAHLRPIWLTPAHDRLFLDGSTERRRFLDRLVFSAIPAHAADVTAYERAQRARMRLLTGPSDIAWLSALEAQAAKTGARIAIARAETVHALDAEIETRAGGPFPTAAVELIGEWEGLAAGGADAKAIEGLSGPSPGRI